ncbi:Septal ring factor EnvC, activator of murein hydrolases AmiA and AmiB [Lishizhenia tianjinensis]|uniref:Septal ring factor EnvC, activator of murein hydrolases AmiA and AmiB n=1 Tax=Lishizhenia tianjinensis TaxID=477690 RepID=A0A1I6ZNI7_9FLAO|nr:peptidoglycan DD-metalloendopeptidase family protein [Lishizhenia tianjinensis]SFT64279.1 Septal ring factor EnvC, activator of murein hydrolases AmiA and AmiB [Lishizhenia tianjinensis]
MKNVSKILILVLPLLLVGSYWAQKTSDRLKQEQAKLEQQIAATKALLENSSKDTKLSLEELKLLNNQVKNRERLLRNFDNQIRSTEATIKEKTLSIDGLNESIDKLKNQYKELLLFAYKRRSKYGQLMYIFSSETIEEAKKRKLYLEKLTEVQKKQLTVIHQKMNALQSDIEDLEKEKVKKLELLAKKKEEREALVQAKQQQENLYQELKAEEESLRKNLHDQEVKKAQLQAKIQEAIRKEIAAEQARLERIRKEKERLRREELARQKAEGGKSPEPLPETADKLDESNGFDQNKGRLPWPVERGTITENYGRNPHPTLNNVFTNNNGVDISSPKNAQVRVVFKGEVTSVFSISGGGKVVIVKHGNYRTVYANLQEVYVTKGMQLDSKQVIGSLLPSKDGELSVVHFEIHVITENGVERLNPNLWIARS